MFQVRFLNVLWVGKVSKAIADALSIVNRIIGINLAEEVRLSAVDFIAERLIACIGHDQMDRLGTVIKDVFKKKHSTE